MIKINHLFSTILMVTLCPLFGQESTIDSLQNALEIAEVDTTKINILIDLAYNTYEDPELQLDYARQAYEIGETTSSIKHKSRSELITGLFYSSVNLDSAVLLMKSGASRYIENDMMRFAANAYYIIGITYEVEKQLDSAVLSYEKAYSMASESNAHPEFGNSAYALANIKNIRGKNVEALKWAQAAKQAFEEGGLTKEIGQVLNQIGIIYDQKGLYSEALDSYLEARDLAIKSGDVDGEILVDNNLGVIYDNMNNSEVAMQYYSDALEKTRIHDLKDSEATLLNNLSYIHLRNGDTLKSVSLLQQSLAIDLSEIYPCFESYPLEGMGAIYINLNKLDSAEYYLDRALKNSMICEDVAVIASVQKDFGLLYSKQKKPKNAKAALEEALQISREANLRAEIQEILYAYYQFHKEYGNGVQALKYLEEYQALTDSIHKENNIEKATQLAAEYEFRKQVTTMEQERLESERIFTEEIEAKSRENRLVLLALVLFILLATTLARSYFLIQKQNKKLKWLNDEKNKLMGIVAHDLRNPLNMILGLMNLFEDVAKNHPDKNLQKYVELLGASSERMRNMIDRVLDISAIENMKVNLKIEKTNLTSLTYESIHNFDIIASQKEIRIIDNIDKLKECFSEVDPNYLVQVIDNLLSNAIKFSDKGKQIEVSLVSENNHHEIVVKDQGPGISKEEQESLFQAYTTLSNKPTAQERSTGLGLSIAYKFVEAMGGKIECHSQPGQGTTFNLIFAKADN
ncbi:tetratricopeptide repeat-containing sensor histidine kinase [Ekhidna sp. To15]|uniref:tetratricopeptide repeat-containing sensor histidine kinase n=1 Tax=Ekhidna sp. To15 TaxID=3395267 RepID=UPI003F52310F